MGGFFPLCRGLTEYVIDQGCLFLLSELLSERCVSCQAKAIRCSDTKEQCDWWFDRNFTDLNKSFFFFLIQPFSALFSAVCSSLHPDLSPDGRAIFSSPVIPPYLMESKKRISSYLMSSSPHWIISPFSTLYLLPLVHFNFFLQKINKIPASSPIFVSIHILSLPHVYYSVVAKGSMALNQALMVMKVM